MRDESMSLRLLHRPREGMHLHRVAGAFLRGVGEVTAGTWIHRAYKDEISGKIYGHSCATDRHPAFFERLPHYVAVVAAEFREFVKEEHPVVSERDLPGPGDYPTADKGAVGDRVMRCAEGATTEHRRIPRKESGDRMNLSCFNRFLESEGRQNGGDARCEHRLP